MTEGPTPTGESSPDAVAAAPSASVSEHAATIAAGYDLDGTALQLGRLVEGTEVARVDIVGGR
jgi:hypothetical protein